MKPMEWIKHFYLFVFSAIFLPDLPDPSVVCTMMTARIYIELFSVSCVSSTPVISPNGTGMC